MEHNHIVPNFRPDTCPACAQIVQEIQDIFDKKDEELSRRGEGVNTVACKATIASSNLAGVSGKVTHIAQRYTGSTLGVLSLPEYPGSPLRSIRVIWTMRVRVPSRVRRQSKECHVRFPHRGDMPAMQRKDHP